MNRLSKILIAAFASFALFACVASATTHTFTINLTPQTDGNTGTGSGSGTASYDDVTGNFSYSYTYAGVTGMVGNSHFHGPAAVGADAPPIASVPIPAMSMSPVTGGPHVISPSEGQDLINGLWYLNIHTDWVPSGELRGQLVNNNPPVDNTALKTSLGNKIKKLKKKLKKASGPKAKKLKKKLKKLKKSLSSLG